LLTCLFKSCEKQLLPCNSCSIILLMTTPKTAAKAVRHFFVAMPSRSWSVTSATSALWTVSPESSARSADSGSVMTFRRYPRQKVLPEVPSQVVYWLFGGIHGKKYPCQKCRLRHTVIFVPISRGGQPIAHRHHSYQSNRDDSLSSFQSNMDYPAFSTYPGTSREPSRFGGPGGGRRLDYWEAASCDLAGTRQHSSIAVLREEEAGTKFLTVFLCRSV
jgi:hypothetical protein